MQGLNGTYDIERTEVTLELENHRMPRRGIITTLYMGSCSILPIQRFVQRISELLHGMAGTNTRAKFYWKTAPNSHLWKVMKRLMNLSLRNDAEYVLHIILFCIFFYCESMIVVYIYSFRNTCLFFHQDE